MRFDQTGKGVLREALSPAGATHPQHEIAAEVQWADLLFEPDRARAPARRGLGLLGRMATRACLFEHFRCTPRLDTVRNCVRKLLSLDRARALHATRTGATRPGFPRLWVLSPGRPKRAIRRFHLRPMRGWPAGFLRAAPALGLRLVVLRDLPRTRDTLLLRLLGRNGTLEQAVEDLLALPCVFRRTWTPVPLGLGHPFRSTWTRSERSDGSPTGAERRVSYRSGATPG